MTTENLRKTLSGKKILFIAPKFYHYNDEMVAKMEYYGADVSFFYERDTSIIHALIDAFLKNLLDYWSDRHYGNILKNVRNHHFDFLFVIHGYGMKGSFVQAIKKLNPGIETIMYQWDSRKNREYLDKIPFFDRTLSFDYEDSENLKLSYVPTFHTDEFSNLPKVTAIYDMFFYGNFTNDRYSRMLELKAYANKNGLKLKTHLYITWKRFLMEKMKGAKIDSSEVSFERMSKALYIKLFNESLVIVDITTNTQTGIAMRVIDALGSGKKIITNNPVIVKEYSYNKEQILIIDNGPFNFPVTFFKPQEFEKFNYSIDRWLENIFVGSINH